MCLVQLFYVNKVTHNSIVVLFILFSKETKTGLNGTTLGNEYKQSAFWLRWRYIVVALFFFVKNPKFFAEICILRMRSTFSDVTVT